MGDYRRRRARQGWRDVELFEGRLRLVQATVDQAFAHRSAHWRQHYIISQYAEVWWHHENARAEAWRHSAPERDTFRVTRALEPSSLPVELHALVASFLH